jgi:drug/metabolite transporter (DMT)-like permease
MRRERVGVVAAVLLVVCWSSGFIGAVLGTRAAPVDTVLAWRTLTSALMLGFWVLLHGQRVSPRALIRQGVLGLLVHVLYLGGVFAATGAGVPAGTSALLAALQPLLVAALAGPLLGERTSRRGQLGLLIAAGGVALVVAGDLGGGHAPAWAYLLPIGALAALAAGTVLERRWRPSQSLATSLALQSTVAAGVFCTVAAADGHLSPPPAVGFWVAIGWLVVLSTFGGYGSFLFVVRRSGATRASTLLYLTAPATALWAWLLLDQPPAPLAIPGVIVCAGGVGLALWRLSPAPRQPSRGASNSADDDTSCRQLG